MWYKELVSFPSWASNYICWKCEASQTTYKQFGAKAPWRQKRLTPRGCCSQKQRAASLEPSPLFKAIGFSLNMVMVDVLHCMDLGVSQDILGNIFSEALDWVCAGTSRKNRVVDLWRRIKQYYKEFQPGTMLQGLTVEMIKQTGKAPKLRAKGAETRHLVPFAVLLAQEIQEIREDSHGNTVLKIASCLFDLYNLFAARPVDYKACTDASRRLCLLFGSLDTHDSWRVKPKFHMMQELCEFQVEEFGSPEAFWAYADESFVGFVAEFSHKRGGAANATSTCEAVLNRYRALAHIV